MVSSPSDFQAAAQAGLEALRRGDPATARALLEPLTASGEAAPAVWLGLALAGRALNDTAKAREAVDRVLDMDPRNFQALMLKGDLCGEANEKRMAATLYSRALRAAPPLNQLPARIADGLRRAEANVKSFQQEFAGHLEASLSRHGFARGASSRRFAESLDILLGRKQVYYQTPQRYYFPALPQAQFYEREQFPWASEFEACTEEIRAELVEVARKDTGFTPYVTAGDQHLPFARTSHLLDNADWSAFFLWKDGKIIEENAARCPRTIEFLGKVPLPKVENTTPSVLFSLLKAGAHIPPHHGMINTRLICHLPLIVPKGCSFRVGNDIREWREGELLIFDDTVEHEAWNRGSQPRYVLLFDIWRPELTEEERTLVKAMFEGMQEFEGPGESYAP